ncbi:MAG: choice-of-anchor D domain-containing protein [Minisyncoccia bacterium]
MKKYTSGGFLFVILFVLLTFAPQAEAATTSLANGVASASVTAVKDSYTYYSVTVPSGATSLTVTTTGGSGDDDIYVKLGSQPVSTNTVCSWNAGDATWRGATPATNESATITNPVAGTYYITIAACSAMTNIVTKATYTVPLVPVLTLSATALSFGNVTLGATSPSQAITLTNTGTASLSITSLFAFTGDFGGSGSCSTSVPLAPGASCVLNVTFTPTMSGSRTGTVTMATNEPGGTKTIPLSGTGVVLAPVLSLSATSMDFGSVNVGTVSPSKPVTITNSGTAALQITDLFSFTGDFSGSGSCSTSVPLAPGASCVLNVTFAPVMSGARTGSITIASNDPGGMKTVTLSGNGVTPVSGAVMLSNGVASAPVTSVVGTDMRYAITVPSGATNLTVTTTGGTGDDDIYVKLGSQPVSTNTVCSWNSGDYTWRGATPATNESVSIANPVAGTYYITIAACSAMTNIVTKAVYTILAPAPTPEPTPVPAPAPTPTPSVISLTSGVASAPVTVAKSVTTYYSVVVPSGATSLTITTTGGTGDADIFMSLGSQPGTKKGTYTWGSSTYATNESIVLTNPVAGTYYITMNAWTAITNIQTKAVYVALAPAPAPTPAPTPTTPALSLSSTALNFGSVSVGTASAAQTLTLTNTGTASLTITSLFAFTGDFSGSGSCSTSVPLAPGASCVLNVTFTPTVVGTLNGTVTIATNDPVGTKVVSLAGTGVSSAPAPAPTPTPTTVIALTNGVASAAVTAPMGTNTFYSIAVPSGVSNLTVTTTGGSGDDDIFMSLGSQPQAVAGGYTWKGATYATNESIVLTNPVAGTYYITMNAWTAITNIQTKAVYTSVTVEPTPTPTPTPAPAPSCTASSSSVTPVIGSKAAWDSKFDGLYGSSLPSLNGGAEVFAWQGHYWVRAYVSMAKTYGDTKYLDRAVKTIDYWFAHQETSQGWGASINQSQMMLDTGVIAQAVSIFSYEVWNDARFVSYRTKADAYLAKIEPILHTYDVQWVEGAPYPGSPSFYRYATCGGLCSTASLIMYNQGATMAKALLLIDRTYRLKGMTPDSGYLHKADASAKYFKTFVRANGSAYVWDYGGARTGTGIEDTSHGHLDLSLLVWAKNFGQGGLTNTDMASLAATMQKVLSSTYGVALRVDGTGAPTSNYDRMPVGYDWIELVDYDSTLLDKVVKVFNSYLPNPSESRSFLGWAEILRKKNCVAL